MIAEVKGTDGSGIIGEWDVGNGGQWRHGSGDHKQCWDVGTVDGGRKDDGGSDNVNGSWGEGGISGRGEGNDEWWWRADGFVMNNGQVVAVDLGGGR